MTVWALGLNHTTAPLDLRGRFAFSLDQIVPTLRDLRSRLAQVTGTRDMRFETALLSTCNRTELYCAVPQGHAPDLVEPTMEWLASSRGVSSNNLLPHTYVLQNDTVARHAFRVASGLDSMVLGEAQILGQMKNAVRAANQAGALGTTLHQLFQRSFSIAKEVRSATEIGEHSISMAAAAVRLAADLFEDLEQIKILFVGAGEMIELAATHFAARHPKHIAIANRTLERGERLGQRFGAEVIRLADLPGRLPEFDAIVSCTASTLPIIGLGAVESALKARRHRPIFMVDLAVPRDIEPEVAHIDDVYLYTLDDLASIVQTGANKRQAAVAQAEGIIDAGVLSFMRWLDERSTVPLIRAVNQQAEVWRQTEMDRARRALARGDDVQSVIESLSHGLTQKLLHGALAELHGADPALRHQAAQAVSRIYLRGSTRHHIPAILPRREEH